MQTRLQRAETEAAQAQEQMQVLVGGETVVGWSAILHLQVAHALVLQQRASVHAAALIEARAVADRALEAARQQHQRWASRGKKTKGRGNVHPPQGGG